MGDSPSLADRRVLVVEDEPLIAMLLEDMLDELGVKLAGAADSVPAALQTLQDGLSFDGAILDMNLHGKSVEPIAQILAERQIPFIFASGYGADDLTRKHAGAPVLMKPFRREALEQALRDVLTGSAQP